MSGATPPEQDERRHERRYADLPGDGRRPAERDRDRILYATAFRRLAHVTQVVSPTERGLVHNRLTHSLEVAQIGRGLANHLLGTQPPERIALAGGIDPWVVEAAALAHDLGHPPFGHVAERELKRLVREDHGIADGYEGNAQSFRIVTKLAERFPDTPGLNLTRATLNAILKYPWYADAEHDGEKWGAYRSEHDDFTWARELAPRGAATQSLEAALMDWADDIAYAIHDVEDFFRAGLIPLDRLALDRLERERFFESQSDALLRRFGRDEPHRALESMMSLVPFTVPYRGTRSDRVRLRSFTSSLVGRYIASTGLADSGWGRDALRIAPPSDVQVALLKRLTWFYVIDRPSLRTERFGQRALIRSLFTVFLDASASPGDWPIFPEEYHEELRTGLTGDERVRLVSDLVSGMSERQAIEIARRLTGRGLEPSMEVSVG